MKESIKKTAFRRWKKKGLIKEEEGKIFTEQKGQKFEVVKEGSEFKLVPVGAKAQQLPL